MRHSQPQPHHGRFDASFLHSWMLTFSEWRMAEQLLSQRGIIQKSPEASPAGGHGPRSIPVRGVFLLSCLEV